MIIVVIFAAALATVANGDISGTNPANGACVCFNTNSVNVRSSACGTVLGMAQNGQCFTYSGSKTTCSLGRSYDFYKINWNGREAWSAGVYLNLASASSCGGSSGDISGTNPANGACLCFNTNSVNVRSSACGSVLGMAQNGQCFKYTGSKTTCTLDRSYDFYKINWNGREAWSAGVYLKLASDSSCGGSGGGGTSAANEYSCQVTDQGKRIHETLSGTPYDCVDNNCGNTCKGGQCVAYVTCRCTRNGRHTPNTACWRPGRSVKLGDGKCNRNIAPNTAIATFGSNSRYTRHAAVFIRCQDDYSVLVYDQWCSRSIGHSTYGSSHDFFKTFATITSPGCSDRSSWPCRSQNSGPTSCPTSVSRCKRATNWLEALQQGADI